jgi:hypothetical protein
MSIQGTNPFSGMDMAGIANSFTQGPAAAAGAAAAPGAAATPAVPTAPGTVAATATPAAATATAPAAKNWNVEFNHQEAKLNDQGGSMVSERATLNSKNEANYTRDAMSFGNGAAPATTTQAIGAAAPTAGQAPASGPSDMFKELGQKMRDAFMGSFDRMLSGMFGGKGAAATPPELGAPAPASAPAAASTAIAPDAGAISTPAPVGAAPAAEGGAPAGAAPAATGNGAPAASGEAPAADGAGEAAEQQQAAPAEGGRCGGGRGHHGSEGAEAPQESAGAAPEAEQQYDAEYESDSASYSETPAEASQQAAAPAAEAEQEYDAEYVSDSASYEETPDTASAQMPWQTAAAPTAPASLPTTTAATAPAPMKNGGQNFNLDRDEYSMKGDQMQMTRWHADWNTNAAPTATGGSTAAGTTGSDNARNSFNLRREQFTLKPRAPKADIAAAPAPAPAPASAAAAPEVKPALAAPTAATAAAPNAELFARFFPGNKKV